MWPLQVQSPWYTFGIDTKGVKRDFTKILLRQEIVAFIGTFAWFVTNLNMGIMKCLVKSTALLSLDYLMLSLKLL